MRRATILIDATVVSDRPTGIGWAAVELLRSLAARDEEDFRFRVAVRYPQALADLATDPRWELIEVPNGGRHLPGRWWWLTAGLDRLVRRCGADLVHTVTMPGPLRLSVPWLTTVHDLVYRVLPWTVPLRRRLWYAATVGPSLARSRLILVNSQATRQEVATHFPSLAPRIRLTRFGTPSWVLASPPAPVRPRGAPWLFVGMLEPRKNVDRLLDAYLGFRELAAGEGELPGLIVVGAPGWRNRSLRRRLERLAAAGILELHGHADRGMLWDLYNRAGLLLFPSLHEGFGFPILEAMAVNLPVLTGNRHAMPEVAGDAALLVDPLRVELIRDAMLRFWRDPGLAPRLAAAGRRRAAAWSWEETARATLAAYREALDGPV